MNRLDLAFVVAELLELPRDGWQGTAYEVVRVIFATIGRALQKGDSVRIDGFGAFRLYTRPATRHATSFVSLGKPWKKGTYWEVVNFPAKVRVIFKPSKALLRYINEHDRHDPTGQEDR